MNKKSEYTKEDTALIAQVDLMLILARDGYLTTTARNHIATNSNALARVRGCIRLLLSEKIDSSSLMDDVRRLSDADLEKKLYSLLRGTGNGAMTVRGLSRTLSFISQV